MMRFVKRKIKLMNSVFIEESSYPTYTFHFKITRCLFGFIKLPSSFGMCEVKTYPSIKSELVMNPIVNGRTIIDEEIEDTVLDAYFKYVCTWIPVEVVRCEIETDED